jgi:predicted dehydrogenase
MNVLIIGLGSIAAKHILSLQALPDEVTIYALRSSKDANLVEGITNIYDLENRDFDFAIISNPTQLHVQYIGILADKNINMMIEKPPLSNLDEASVLIKKIKEKDIKTYVACNLRFHPCLVFIKKYLSQNNTKKINEVNVYCGSYLPDWRPNKDFRQIYSAIPELGGGVHLDLFHELDYTHWLFGKPLQSTSFKKNLSSLHIEAIDYANYVLEYQDFTASIVLNYFRKDAKRTIEIVFEDQTITIDLIKNTIVNHLGEKLFEAINFKIIDTYKDQMQFFVNSLKANQKQMNTFADSVEVLKTCLDNE